MIYRKQSPIGWTDYSGGNLNFIVGCMPVLEGCQNCYARCWAETWGRDFSKVRIYPEKLESLLTDKFIGPFKRGCERPMCFVVDLGDLFHPDVPDSFIMRALEIFSRRIDVDWQVLTKRPERMYNLWGGDYLAQNIWVGVTAENQQRANECILALINMRKWNRTIRFVSVEPMLEPIMLPGLADLQWVICGAESGPNRRSFNSEWALDLWRQCQEARVPFFGKQDSAMRPGKPLLLEGQEVKEWPR